MEERPPFIDNGERNAWRLIRAMPAEAPPTVADQVETVLLHAEDIGVSKRIVQTGVVRVVTTTRETTQYVEEVLGLESVEVERVHIGRVVSAAPDIRQDGDVTIVPVVEEMLVIEKQLVLKEEIRIRRVRTTTTHREAVQLREQVASITRQAAVGVAQPYVSPSTEDDIL